MKDRLIIDVVIPTYNREETLKRSICSVLDQSYSIRKVIVVDDASDDGTEDIIQQICDDRILYIKNKTQKGANYSRNIGIKASDAPFIAFQDSDDMWHKDKIERQISVLQKSEDVCGVFSPYWLVHKKKKTLMGSCNTDDINRLHYRLLKGNVIGTPTLLVDRSVLENVGYFDETLPKYQDWDLSLRITENYRLAYIDEPLVTAYRLTESITSNMYNAVDALKIIARRQCSSISNESLISRWVELFITNGSIIPDELTDFLGIFCVDEQMKNCILKNVLLSTQDKLNRSDKYLDITCSLLEDESITKFLLGHGISKVSIYGNSKFGNALQKMLEKKGILIEAFVDRDNKKFCEKPLYNAEQFIKLFSDKETILLNTVPSLDDEIKDIMPGIRVYNIAEMV